MTRQPPVGPALRHERRRPREHRAVAQRGAPRRGLAIHQGCRSAWLWARSCSCRPGLTDVSCTTVLPPGRRFIARKYQTAGAGHVVWRYQAASPAPISQSVLVREGGGGGARRDTDFVEDVLDVSTNGVLADAQLLGDLAVGSPGGDQGEHLDLALGQVPGRWRCHRRELRCQLVQVGHRTQPFERLPGGVGLEVGGISIAEVAAGQRPEQPRPGCS